MSGIAYLDASALVKLVVAEPETSALGAAIRTRWPHAVASEIIAIEAHRAARRVGGDAPAIAARRLRAVAQLPLTISILEQSARIGPAELRALDAIHLATALAARDRIDAFLTYDRRLADAARAEGLAVESPA